MPPHETIIDVVGPLFYQAVTLVERRDLTREEALIHLSLELAELATSQQRRILDYVSMQIHVPIVIDAPRA